MGHPRHAPLATLLLALAACQGPSAALREGRELQATPQRPTLSEDTATTAAGTFELEAGVLLDPEDRLDTPVTLKYGVDARSEVSLAFSPFVFVELPGDDGEGFGDLLLGYRARVLDQQGERPSVGWAASVKLPTGDEDEGLGSGELDAFVAGMASYNARGWGATGYAQLGLLGEPDGSGLDHRELLALSAARAMDPETALFGELAGVFTPERDDEQVLAIGGMTWSPAPGFVLDLGGLVGLSSDAPDLQLFLGFTRNLGPAAGWSPRVLPRDG